MECMWTMQTLYAPWWDFLDILLGHQCSLPGNLVSLWHSDHFLDLTMWKLRQRAPLYIRPLVEVAKAWWNHSLIDQQPSLSGFWDILVLHSSPIKKSKLDLAWRVDREGFSPNLKPIKTTRLPGKDHWFPGRVCRKSHQVVLQGMLDWLSINQLGPLILAQMPGFYLIESHSAE